MTPIGPYLRHTMDSYLRIALDIPRAAHITNTDRYTITGSQGLNFLHLVTFFTVRTINGIGYSIDSQARNVINWMRVFSR